jgi:hypothetical protein
MSTNAETLGGTPHFSPVLRKARRCGLRTSDDLLRVAVGRGCRHYAPVDFDPQATFDPGRDRLSDLEVAIAMLTGAQSYEPQLVRCAAQLLGAPGLRPDRVARMAVMERCVAVVRHIAEAGQRHDRLGGAFWTGVLAGLPPSPPVRAGVLPHPSRFVVQTGFAGRRPVPEVQTVWLRPAVA